MLFYSFAQSLYVCYLSSILMLHPELFGGEAWSKLGSISSRFGSQVVF